MHEIDETRYQRAIDFPNFSTILFCLRCGGVVYDHEKTIGQHDVFHQAIVDIAEAVQAMAEKK